MASNQQIARGELATRQGEIVTEPVGGAPIRAGRQYCYPIRSDFAHRRNIYAQEYTTTGVKVGIV